MKRKKIAKRTKKSAKKAVAKRKTRGISKKSKCHVAGSQLGTKGSAKKTKSKAGSKLGSKYCKH